MNESKHDFTERQEDWNGQDKGVGGVALKVDRGQVLKGFIKHT